MPDYFEVLGVPRAYHIDHADAESRFHTLSKQWHPDRFAKASRREHLEALSRSRDLNDAWRVLKADVKRAEYLLKLEGIDISDEKSASVKPDAALLMRIMELNEQLAEADAPTQRALFVEVAQLRERAIQEVDRDFQRYEAGDRSVLPALAQSLIAMRYYARFGEHADDGEL
jgi:molecular chaperone HscB